jgi:hypothetical protein
MKDTNSFAQKIKKFFVFNYKAAIALGIFLVVAGAQSSIGPLVGWVVIFGALAYNSARNIRLGIVKSSIYKQILVVGDLALLLILVLYQGTEQNVQHPLALIAWIACFGAYIGMFVRHKATADASAQA